jgi:hypothetical protein
MIDKRKKEGFGYDVSGNPLTQSAIYSQSVVGNTDITGNADIKYDSNNYNIEYHDSANEINAQQPLYELNISTLNVPDSSGNTVSYPVITGLALPTYYQPGSMMFGPVSYVPNYEDSVYLSRSTGLSTLKDYGPTTKSAGGFCSFYENDKVKQEQKCGALSSDVCGSVSCCVLLGGAKCVAGDEKGPHFKANYTDPFIKNKEVYYYKGRCYGNCME